MGQQQLIILILVTIVVGISMVVAVNNFDSAAVLANQDAVRNDITILASVAQEYYLKPELLGGGGRVFNGFTLHNTAFPAAGITADGQVAETENGTYIIPDPGVTSFIIIAHPSSCEGYTRGSIDSSGVLTNFGTCSHASDQITALVTFNGIEFLE